MPPDRKHKSTKMPYAESHSFLKHSLTKELCSCPPQFTQVTPAVPCPLHQLVLYTHLHVFALFPLRKLKREGEGKKKRFKGQGRSNYDDCDLGLLCPEEVRDIPSFKPSLL